MGSFPAPTRALSADVLAEVWPSCDLSATAAKDARQVTVIAVVCALTTATSVGYYLGRRAGAGRPSWKKRTGRIALGKLALTFLAVVTARRVQRCFRAGHPHAGIPGRLGPRATAPLGLLRDTMVRLRSY